MKEIREFDFARSRPATLKELRAAHKAIEEKLGVKRPWRGRPPKKKNARYKAVSIRLHPKVLYWAKQQAKKRKMGYQTVVNEALLKLSSKT